jgi:sugar O-acyltransferase (sialic acid O-acetyltransferase NeuD family)
MKRLVIYGTGLIAEVADFYFTNDSDYEVVGFTNSQEFISEEAFLGRPLVPFENIRETHPAQNFDLFIALGYAKRNRIRAQRFREASEMGYTLATYVSSRATVFSSRIGSNCFVLENNVIQPFTQIGDNTTLWSGNHIGHHTVIGSHVFISSHVVVSGVCEIGDSSFLGVNSTIHDNVSIGAFSIIGAGAIVEMNLPERSFVKQPASPVS